MSIGSGLGLGLWLGLVLVLIWLQLGWGRNLAHVVYICPLWTENNTECYLDQL